MLPALPTGIARTSGGPPRSSQTSKAAVFWPSSRYGLTELTSVIGCVVLLGKLADDRQGGIEVAADGEDLRPGGLRLEELAGGDLAGRQDDDDLEAGGGAVGRGRGRRVPGRGADDRRRALPRRALATAMTMPRSLNEPVGFSPSNLR